MCTAWTRPSIETSLRSVPSSPSSSSAGGRSPRISERSSSSAWPASSRSLSTWARADARIALQLGRRRLGAQHQAEQLLADHVVELEGEAVALGDDRQLAALLVQARVGDRDRGVRGEDLDHPLILDAEGARSFLLGQVERADRPLGRDDRDSQERAHVRMPARPPAAEPVVVVDVVGTVRLRLVSIAPSIPWVRGSGPMRCDQLVAHPGDEEAAEAALAVRDPKRGIACAGQLLRPPRPIAAAPRRRTAATRPPGPRR